MLGNHLLGLYEKALPPELTWEERLRAVTELGFDYLEISIDEKDERLARLDWTQTERGVLHRAMRETGAHPVNVSERPPPLPLRQRRSRRARTRA